MNLRNINNEYVQYKCYVPQSCLILVTHGIRETSLALFSMPQYRSSTMSTTCSPILLQGVPQFYIMRPQSWKWWCRSQHAFRQCMSG